MTQYNGLMRRFPTGTKAEARVESFLEKNVDLIEPGLRLIRRQYPLNTLAKHMVGKMDLYCQGADGADVCVELVSMNLSSNDLGQMMAYHDILSGRVRGHKPPPRIYAIGPGMTPAFGHALNVLDGGRQINLSVLFFTPRVEVKLEDEEWAVDLYVPETHMKMRM